MIRCILIDDEPLVRIGIRKKVDFVANGFEIVGEANDALEALELVTALKPDVIFTDIRMPVMDGIELIKRSSEIHPELISVLLSGHRDFEYAKQGIQINALDYLSKPIVPEELLKTLEKIKNTIKVKKLQLMKRWQEELHTWFLTGSSKYGLVELQGEYSIHIFYNHHLYHHKPWIDLLQYEDELLSLYSLKEFSIQLIVPLWHPNVLREHKFILFTLWADAISSQKLQQWTLILENSLGGANCLWSAATPIRRSFELLKRDYEHLNKALKWNRVLQLPMSILQPFSTLALQKQVMEWNMKQLTMQSWLESIVQNSYSEAMVKSYLNEASKLQNKTTAHWFEQFLVNQIVFILKHMSVRQTEEISLEDQVIREIRALASKEQTYQYLEKNINSCVHEQESKFGRSTKLIMQQIIAYLDVNYTEPLTIRALADKFGLHRGYLSRQFKEVFEMTFTDYITQKRLEASIKLLQHTLLSIKDIAEKVGYEDTGYYMRLFKKRYSLTPSEYRERHSELNPVRWK